MRKTNDFLEDYLKFAEECSESPISYHTWAGVSVVASVLQRKVFMRWGHTLIYPNQYIVLIGPSGVRKGEPLRIAKDFLDRVGIFLVPEVITKEQLIRRMKEHHLQYEGEDGELREQHPVTVISEELSVFISQNDPKFLGDLTNWYDSLDKWTYDTKNKGTDVVNGVCMNILASMAPDWIPMTIPMGAIGGGFTSRILFIVEYKKGKTIADPSAIGIDETLRQNLRDDLEAMLILSGEMKFSDEAKKRYMKWYTIEEQNTASGRPALSDPRFGGYVSRRATHVKKIAMVCCAARGNSMMIQVEDFDRSLSLMEQAELTMTDVFGKIGKSMYAEQTQDVMNFIRMKKRTTRSDVMQNFYRDIDDSTLNIIEATLRAARFIKTVPNASKGDMDYVWID